jgi:hypothetical protein
LIAKRVIISNDHVKHVFLDFPVIFEKMARMVAKNIKALTFFVHDKIRIIDTAPFWQCCGAWNPSDYIAAPTPALTAPLAIYTLLFLTNTFEQII